MLNNLSKPKRIIAWTIIVVLLFLTFDLSPLGGNIRFYAKWVECSQKPVRTDAYPGGGIMFYESTPIFQPFFRQHEEYFCTPLEAEQAGYSANPDRYEFPHLNSKN